MEEIYSLVEHALREGQDHIEVHAFPFRMTRAKLDAHAQSLWHGHWMNLKEAFDLFDTTRVPPKVFVCGGKYVVLDGGDGDYSVPYSPPACDAEPSDIATVQTSEANGDTGSSKRHAVVPAQSQRSAGRDVRKAYAAARQARVAAHAKRTRVVGKRG